ncbi:PREDICTED: probable G-protein coupled receptor 62 [Galeopterus variegatus]|uniref:Probable G-protein coupled receptor 62 n=1 Tax=Galeopterus variegatus TaxID=482537 RepID=A0ABM0RRM4_GALVR|nr:PREDICTED: probable G-protein coupled receptor 62 [Galeopterus variegatus]
MANTTELNATEVAGSVGLILAAVLEVGALLGNSALLVVVLRTPGLGDALYLVHLCIVDLLAAASIMPLGLLAAPPSGLGRVRLGPAPCRAARFLSSALLPACTLGVAALGLARCLRPPRPARGARLRSDSLDSRLSILPPLWPRLPGGKAALAPALAVGQFAACWLPYGCACLAPAARVAEAEAAVTWVAYSAFAAHPFLYGLLQRPVRLALGRLTCRVLPRPLRACARQACSRQAWHPQALLQRLQGPASEGSALGPTEAPKQVPTWAGGQRLSMPEAT